MAIRVPGEIVKRCRLREGERVQIETEDGDIIIRRELPRFELWELFQDKSPDEWRALYRRVFDWGPDLGREMVEEW